MSQPTIYAGSAHPGLASETAACLGLQLAATGTVRFPDGEVHVELRDNPRGRDVFLIQPTGEPQDENLFELLCLADAARRAGAHSITAVVPYFGYARQDKRIPGRYEGIAARLVADLMVCSGIQQLVTLDLHTDAIEGFFTSPLQRLSAVPLLAEAVKAKSPADGVIVAPDLGAAKLAEAYAGLLSLPTAIVRKTRTGPAAVSVSGVSGDVRGRTPIIIDDMISTGGTIEAAIRAVEGAGARAGSAVVAATHGLFAGDCLQRLQRMNISRLLVTDSLAPKQHPGVDVEIVSVASLLADGIRRFCEEQDVHQI